MAWTDIIWKATKLVFKKTISAGPKGLDALGSLACTGGGAVIALSYSMDETVLASYFGSANITGNVNVNTYIPQYTYDVNDTIPFQDYLQHDEGVAYNLQDYISPSLVSQYAIIASSVGLTLKVLGANLNVLFRGLKERSDLNEHYGLNSKSVADRGQYYNATAGAVVASFAYTCLGCSVTDLALQYFGFKGSSQRITYPSVGEGQIDSAHYKGPVADVLVPVEYDLKHNMTVNLPVVNEILLEENVNVTALVNGTYGGGLFFNNKANNDIPSQTLLAASVIAGIGAGFFSERQDELRTKRRIETYVSPYTLIS